MGKVILYLAVSLDGYIARENGDVNWLPSAENEDFGYSEFYKTIDTVIMGRKTYDQVLTFGNFPYADKQCFVFSRSNEGKNNFVEFVNEDIELFTHRLKEHGSQNIWLVGGAELIDTFIKRNMIDDFILTVIPVILGKGIPLFTGDNPEIKLLLKGSKTFSQGVIEVYYSKGEAHVQRKSD